MADELSLGTIFNYQGNADNALGSGNYGNETLLDTIPATNAALAQFGAFIQKKRDDEYKDWHNNMINTISSVKKTDGIYGGDAEKINESLKKVIGDLINNPASQRSDAFLKDPQAYQDQQAALGDHAVLVQQSKDFNALLKGWEKTTSTTSDLNNEVNALQIEQLKKASPEERVSLIEKIHPISDGDKELQIAENAYYKNPTNKIVTREENPLDKGKYDRIVTGVYDLESYLPVFTLAKGQYLAKKFELDKGLQEAYHGDVNEYIKHEAKDRLRENMIVEKTTSDKNEEYYQNRLDSRQATQIASNEKIAYARIAQQKEAAAQRATKVPELNTLNDKFDDLNKIMDDNSVERDFFGTKAKVSIVPSTSLNENLEKYINTQRIPIGRDENDKVIYKQATSLLRVESLDGNTVKYLPAYQGEEIKSEFITDKQSPLSESAIKARMADAKEMKALDEYNSSHKSTPQSTSQPEKSTYKYENINGYVNEFKQMGLGIGSIDTGGHNQGSLHGKTLAVDIPASTNGGVEGLKKKLVELRSKYPELDIVDEIIKPDGQKVWTGAHIHIEMDGKKADYLSKSKEEPKSKKIVKGVTSKGVSGIKWK